MKDEVLTIIEKVQQQILKLSEKKDSSRKDIELLKENYSHLIKSVRKIYNSSGRNK